MKGLAMGSGADGRRAAADTCDTVIRNARVVTMDADRTVWDPGALAVRDGAIAAIGPDAQVCAEHRAPHVIDARGAIVHPGLVDAHCHMTLHTTRGALLESPPSRPGTSARASFGGLIRWLGALDDEDEHASALLACSEMALSGVTCFMDPGTAFEPDTVARAAEAVGVRGSVADPFLWDIEGNLAMASAIPRAPASAARARELLGGQVRRNADPDALVRGHVAVYGSGSASEELELAAKECAARHDCILTQHQSLDAADAGNDRARFGRDALVHLAEIGVLDERCAFMHMNALTPPEVDAVVDSGMSVIWQPGNALYYGIASTAASPMPGLRARGATVTVGTDVAKAWGLADMGWLAYLLVRAAGGAIDAEDVLELHTRAGARAVGLDDRIGSLEPGKRADLVVRREDLPQAQPGLDPLRECMLLSRAASVATVLVEGRVVVRDGRLARVDADSVFQRARRSARRVAERAAMSESAVRA